MFSKAFSLRLIRNIPKALEKGSWKLNNKLIFNYPAFNAKTLFQYSPIMNFSTTNPKHEEVESILTEVGTQEIGEDHEEPIVSLQSNNNHNLGPST